MVAHARALGMRGPLVLAAVMLLACGGGGGGDGTTGPGPGPPPPPPADPTPPSPPPTGNVVEVQLLSSLRFEPENLSISPGTTVRWVHAGPNGLLHTVTPEGHTEWRTGSRSSQGTVLEHTFQSEGDFPYFCEPHLSVGMVGRVTVE